MKHAKIARAWAMSHEEMRERVEKLRAEGWAMAAIGRCAGCWDTPAQWLSNRLRHPDRTTDTERLRISRALLLIEQGAVRQERIGREKVAVHQAPTKPFRVEKTFDLSKGTFATTMTRIPTHKELLR